MPNRYQVNQRNAIYPFIAERDGEYCLACFIETGQRRGPKSVKLEIDHADCDKSNWDPRNLHLLCKTHNIKFRSLSVKQHISVMAGYSAENESVRVRNNEHTAESRRKSLYLSGSPEMQVNSIAYGKWLEFMHSWIDANGSISKKDAIEAGALAADDVDVQTTARYYKKRVSVLGEFKEVKVNGEIRVFYRHDEKVQRTPEVRTNGNGHSKNLENTVEIVK
jgi:hypothetical protein